MDLVFKKLKTKGLIYEIYGTRNNLNRNFSGSTEKFVNIFEIIDSPTFDNDHAAILEY